MPLSWKRQTKAVPLTVPLIVIGSKTWMWLILALLLASGGLVAQTSPLSNLRDTVMSVNPAGQLLDSLTVVPNSLALYDAETYYPLPTPGYKLQARFLLWTSPELHNAIRATYRGLPTARAVRVSLLVSSHTLPAIVTCVIVLSIRYVLSRLMNN